METLKCAECGAELEPGKTCRDYLNEMIKWDFEDFLGVGQIHHLTVLCYNLQHPSVYSKIGLEEAKKDLEIFLANPEKFTEHDKVHRENLSSDVRDWKIIGTADDHGKYLAAPEWSMRADDIVKAGLDNYVENVKNWGESVSDSLRESGNLK